MRWKGARSWPSCARVTAHGSETLQSTVRSLIFCNRVTKRCIVELASTPGGALPDVHRALLRDTGVEEQCVATVPSVGASTCRRSSYTLFCVTLRERIDLDFVACLAEGRGSVLAVLATSFASDRRSACANSSRRVHCGHHERAHPRVTCGAGAMKRWIFRFKEAVRGASDPAYRRGGAAHRHAAGQEDGEKGRHWSREAVGGKNRVAERVAWRARGLLRQGGRVAQVIRNCWRPSWQAPAFSCRWW